MISKKLFTELSKLILLVGLESVVVVRSNMNDKLVATFGRRDREALKFWDCDWALDFWVE